MKRRIEEAIKERLKEIIDVNICESEEELPNTIIVKSVPTTFEYMNKLHSFDIDINELMLAAVINEFSFKIQQDVIKRLTKFSLNEFDIQYIIEKYSPKSIICSAKIATELQYRKDFEIALGYRGSNGDIFCPGTYWGVKIYCDPYKIWEDMSYQICTEDNLATVDLKFIGVSEEEDDDTGKPCTCYKLGIRYN